MTTSATAIKFIFTPIAISATVFAALTLPLNLFGSKPVTVQIQEEPIFFGELKEFAPQYLGIAGLLSAGVGLTSVAMMGWRQSCRKSAEIEQELAKLAQALEEKQKLLDNVRSSKSQLDASGLQNWLNKEATQLDSTTPSQDNQVSSLSNPIQQDSSEIEVSLETALKQQVSSVANLAPVNAIEASPQVEPQVMGDSRITSAQVNSMQALAESLASAQAVFDNTPVQESQPSSPTTPSEIEKMDHQLEQMMAHIVYLRQVLQSNQQAVDNRVEEGNERRHGLKLVS